MTDAEWRSIIEAGGQAVHQAREILARPLSAWEIGMPQAGWRAWAEAVVALERNDPEDR
jgi:hypothetical protein